MDSFERLKALHDIAALGTSDLAQVERDIDRIQSERSLYHFIKSGWKYIDPSPFVDGWHIQAVAEHLEALAHGEIKHLLINQPPRTMKSISVSVALCPWVWAQHGNRLLIPPDSPSRPPHPPFIGSHADGANRDSPPLLTGPISGTPVHSGKQYPLLGPKVSFLYASYGQHLSLRDSVKARRLMQSPWYKENWKHVELIDDSNTKTRFDNNFGGYRIATSVGGALTGEGASIIVCDDAHNTVDIESDVIREGVLQWWDESMSTRLNDPRTGAFIVVMQRLHERDLAGHILAKNEGDWCHLMLPMEYEPLRHCETSIGWNDPRGLDENGEVLEGLDVEATPPKIVKGSPMEEAEGLLLCPERFGPEEVLNLKKALGPFASDGQLQQRPVPRGGGIIKDEWWQMFPQKGDEGLYISKKWNGEEYVETLNYPPMEFVMAYADTAYTEKEENDYSACSVFGVFRDKNDNAKIMLMKCWKERLELHKLVVKLAQTCRLGKNSYVDRLVIENKASGKSAAQEIIRLFGSEKWSTQMDDPKGDKVARAYSVQYIFADRMVFAPNREWADMAINECASFPKGEHDDVADTVIGGVKWLRDNGFIEMRREKSIADHSSKLLRGKDAPVYDC